MCVGTLRSGVHPAAVHGSVLGGIHGVVEHETTDTPAASEQQNHDPEDQSDHSETAAAAPTAAPVDLLGDRLSTGFHIGHGRPEGDLVALEPDRPLAARS